MRSMIFGGAALLWAGAAQAQDPPPATDAPVRGDEDWRIRERERELLNPRGDWRDQPWVSEAWRARPPEDRGYERPGRSWRARQTVAAGPYRWPAGVRPRTFAPGERLAPALRSASLADWAALGLPAPQAGADWVRVASDALEVRAVDGAIGRIAYGLFR